MLKLKIFGGSIKFRSIAPDMGANEMISKFLDIKESYRQDLGDLTNEDPDAKRYFCQDDCMYVFSRDIIADIYETIKDNENNCLILFQGLKKETEGDNAFGRPTLIACAYKTNAEGDTLYWTITNQGVEAYEHPGDGGGGTLGKSAVVIQNQQGAEQHYDIRKQIDVDNINLSFI